MTGMMEGVGEVAHVEETGGKVAVVAGGNSGIGLATAQRFVVEGAIPAVARRPASEHEWVK